MTVPILVLRVTRRAVAAVALADEHLTFYDGRHLGSHRDAAVNTISRYARRLLDLTEPAAIVVDAPKLEGSQTEALLAALDSLLTVDHIPVHQVSLPNLLAAFGIPSLRSRTELRALAQPLFPELETVRGGIKSLLLEAAAGALWTDTQVALGDHLSTA